MFPLMCRSRPLLQHRTPARRASALASSQRRRRWAATWPLRVIPVGMTPTSEQSKSPKGRRLQLTCGPRISFRAASMCLQVSASSLWPCCSRAQAFVRPRPRPCHRVLPTIAERSRRLRFLAFSWRHAPLLRREWNRRSRARTSAVDTYQETNNSRDKQHLNAISRLPLSGNVLYHEKSLSPVAVHGR
jgi:hypothetical protein